ncbi:hypothetical protein Y032_0051g2080 [Ancylostoma ceylanicum]|uniref:Integrase catalytic domain-containing protein n=1 Tax=Ancylostoma ceylanicum TaxID=53326 RepID=A0A016U7R3_9BILA|nr:hypothetical protein Y032_0051g2080 [Ancylostoma ceylanicum]
MFNTIAKFIRTCAVCQKIKTPSGHIIREELGSLPIPQRPFERLHTDIVGPLPQCIKGNKFISMTVCAFSKLIICTPIPNQITEIVVKALLDDVISKHGIPNEIVSDRGSNYTSEIFAQIDKILGISNQLTTSYNHKANGQVERLVKVITDSLTAYCSDAQDLWSDFLQPIVFIYNTSINDTTGYSPFFVAYGRHLITWSDIVHQLPSRLAFATESFTDQLTTALQTIIVDVGNQIAKKTASYKSGYDYQNKVYTKDISTRDLVLLRDDTVRPKFTHQWKGPLVVKSVSRPNATIANLIGRTSSRTVHMNRLKIYSPRSTSANVSTPNQTNHTPSNSETSEDEEPNLRRSRRLQLKRRAFSTPPPAIAQEN